MILLDANLLLYAYFEASPQHRRARSWLEETLAGPEPVALSWPVILAFLPIGTNPRAMQPALSLDAATDIVGSWLACRNVTLAAPGEGHWDVMREVMASGQAAGALVSDAHWAALAIEHGALLCSSHRDFSRFPGLRWVNPLA